MVDGASQSSEDELRDLACLFSRRGGDDCERRKGLGKQPEGSLHVGLALRAAGCRARTESLGAESGVDLWSVVGGAIVEQDVQRRLPRGLHAVGEGRGDRSAVFGVGDGKADEGIAVGVHHELEVEVERLVTEHDGDLGPITHPLCTREEGLETPARCLFVR